MLSRCLIRKIFAILCIIMIIMLVGCTKTSKTKGPAEVKYHKGTDGLIISFIENMPPKELKVKSDFVVGLEIKNKGAFDIREGFIKIVGYEKNYVKIGNSDDYPVIDFNKYEAVFGKSDAYPEGDYKVETLNGVIKGIAFGKKEDITSAAFSVIAQYKYQTDAVLPICIDANPYPFIKPKEKICEMKETSFADGQGAPLAITKISPQAIRQTDKMFLEFTITISNKGNGDVFAENDDSPAITISNAKISNKELECPPSLLKKDVKDSKDYSIVCRTKDAMEIQTTPYLAPLSLQLDYTYNTKLEKQIKILG